jgi:hypothetical protein
MKKIAEKIVFYGARILAVLFIIFISLFALDVFGEGYSAPETIIALFMHLIPTILLILVLVLSIKNPRLGGAMFILVGVTYLIMTSGKMDIVTKFIIGGPPIIAGVLFLFSRPEKK